MVRGNNSRMFQLCDMFLHTTELLGTGKDACKILGFVMMQGKTNQVGPTQCLVLTWLHTFMSNPLFSPPSRLDYLTAAPIRRTGARSMRG